MTDGSGPGPPPAAIAGAVLTVCALVLGLVVGGPVTAAGLVVSLAVVLGAVLWLGDRV